MPQISELWIYGFQFDADGLPDVGKPVTATLSAPIYRTADALLVQADEPVSPPTATVNGVGRWSMPLHPNNQPGDQPQNTYWTLHRDGSPDEILVLPYDAVGGADDASALNYTAYITLPQDLPAPTSGQLAALTQAVADINTELNLMNTLDSAGLAALTPSVPTYLVDAASAASADATTSTHGLMSSTDKTKLNALDGTLYAKLNTAKDAIKIPVRADPSQTDGGFTPEGWLYQSSTDLSVRVQAGGVTSRSQIAPGWDAPAVQLSTDVTITSTTPQTIQTVPVVANALYFIAGPLIYVAQGQYDIGIRFSAIPAGATLRWGAAGLSDTTTPGAGGHGDIDARLRTGSNEMLLPGQGTTALFTGQTTPGAVSVYLYGTLRTGANGGTLNFQGRQNIITSGAAITPLMAAGTAISFQRVL